MEKSVSMAVMILEYLSAYSNHLIVIGIAVLILNCTIAIFFVRVNLLLLVLMSMFFGFIYSFMFDIVEFALVSVLFSAALSGLGIGTAKVYHHFKGDEKVASQENL
ncbi:hypothetical protein [Falsibacillus albus]|uniref:Uncharacterized protein n=1 Tax=Falsibacillus albus TaxID=2478915 RepID=A0A3L7JZT5_9BACI|nr:hypothetical protein [Falsibacillus albus]RLQ96266.1 hypothetical protein D9X91_08245 [Falsibacillus albus]